MLADRACPFGLNTNPEVFGQQAPGPLPALPPPCLCYLSPCPWLIIFCRHTDRGPETLCRSRALPETTCFCTPQVLLVLSRRLPKELRPVKRTKEGWRESHT